MELAKIDKEDERQLEEFRLRIKKKLYIICKVIAFYKLHLYK